MFKKAVGLIEVILHEKLAKNRVRMTAKSIMDVYQGRSNYITIAKFGKLDVSLSKHLNDGEVANVKFKLVHVKTERL